MKKLLTIIMSIILSFTLIGSTIKSNKDISKAIFQMFFGSNGISMSYDSENDYCNNHNNYFPQNENMTFRRKVYMITDSGDTIGYAYILGKKYNIDRIKYILYVRQEDSIRFIAIDRRDKIDKEIGLYGLCFFKRREGK